MAANDFSGVWRSSYFKPDEPDVVTEQYVTLRLLGNQLIMESIPGPDDSYLFGRFSIDGRVLTGSYQSQNSPNNSTKGAIYVGAAQLVLEEDGQSLHGMGCGYGKDMVVRNTSWDLYHVGQHQPQKSVDVEQEEPVEADTSA
jgi:hypothetical protein